MCERELVRLDGRRIRKCHVTTHLSRVKRHIPTKSPAPGGQLIESIRINRGQLSRVGTDLRSPYTKYALPKLFNLFKNFINFVSPLRLE